MLIEKAQLAGRKTATSYRFDNGTSELREDGTHAGEFFTCDLSKGGRRSRHLQKEVNGARQNKYIRDRGHTSLSERVKTNKQEGKLEQGK